MIPDGRIHGDVANGFGAVADAFARILEPREAGAAAVAVMLEGVPVVDLWGGVEEAFGRAMARDSLMLVASCSKGVTATVLAMLVERGAIDPSDLVSRHWPEYGCHGKEETTVAMVASHRAGLPFPPLGSGLTGLDYHRGPALLDALANAEPLWTPGTAMAYHSVTYGALLGEIIRRATGRTVGQHLQSLISRPLGLDLWIGLPSDLAGRLIPGRWSLDPSSDGPDPEPAAGTYADLRRRSQAESAPIGPDWDDPAQIRSMAGEELPAVNAATTARSLARMYAATIGEVDGIRLYSDQTRHLVGSALTDDVDTLIESGTAGPNIRFGLGYQLASPSMPGFGPASFGHTGAGGRLGIADPTLGLSFGFVCSRMGVIGPHGDDRWSLLIESIRACLS